MPKIIESFNKKLKIAYNTIMKFAAWILTIIACSAFILAAYNLFNVYTHPLKYQIEIVKYSTTNDLSPALIASVINVESSFNETAKSSKNALGLMQIKLSTANYMNEISGEKSIEENDLYKPSINIKLGCQYLKYLIDKFDEIDTALAAYNAGETRVRTWLKSGIYSTDGKKLMYIPFEETRNYVEKINKNIKYYNKILKNL